MKKFIFLTLTTITTCSLAQTASKPFILQQLKTEYTTCPLGTDIPQPHFSWQMISPNPTQKGLHQTAYRITVTDEHGQQTWNSGRQTHDTSINVAYNGTALQPTTRYHWTVTVWNQNNDSISQSSWFETGLMEPSDKGKGWSGAKWIGGDDNHLTFYPHYLPVFRLQYTVQMDKKSNTTRAGFVFGANDKRLLNKNMNLLEMNNAHNEAYICVELNTQPLTDGSGQAQLNIFRAGYHPNDKATKPLKTFTIPLEWVNKSNRFEPHTISIATNLGGTQICMDGEKNEVGRLNLNPIGQGGDFIAFPVVGDVGFKMPAKQKAIFTQVKVKNFRSPQNTLSALQPTQHVADGGTQGSLLTFTPDGHSSPMLRTAFSTTNTAQIAKARLYVTARGVYQINLNGKQVGNDWFNPGATQYNKTHHYQTYDVQPLLTNGNNHLTAYLSEGWWSGGMTYSGENWNFFGDRQSLLAKLVITYKDGTQKTIVSEPQTWQFCANGPIRYSSIFQGEVYDASLPTDSLQWQKAVEVPTTGNVSEEGWENMPWINNFDHCQLIGQTEDAVQAVQTLTAQSMDEPRKGLFVYDMGQNMVGVPEIHLSGLKPGTKVCLRFAEVKYPNLPEYAGKEGMLMLENIRAAMAQDIYIAKGGEETFCPHFTYHGYRFVELSGIDTPLPLNAVKGVALSSVHQWTANYHTSNPLVNKLWENIKWSMQGNFFSIPTDCPQRNERMGWAGDISVFSRTASYLAQVPLFLRNYLQAMRNIQRPDGRFPDIAPVGGGFGGLLWGSAGITVPWECYQQYADTTLLKAHFPAMMQYVHHICQKMMDPNTGIIVQDRAWGDLGDWLGLEEEKNDKSLLWESYFIYDLDILSKMAHVLQKEDEAIWLEQLLNERKALFNRTYIRKEDAKTIASDFQPKRKGQLVDIQTSYALPLAFNIVDPTLKPRFVENLVQTLQRENVTDQGRKCPPFSLMTGFIGTAWISKALSDNGHSAMAYRQLQQTTYPSWLYPVEQGATTIWERLNSYTHANGFGGNNRMNSFNHYSFGAVGSWMCNYSLGIQRDELHPAFKHFTLQPTPDESGTMTWANGHYDSMYGRIESAWKKQNGTTHYTFTVPANTTATICLPTKDGAKLTSNGRKVKKMHNGVLTLKRTEHTTVMEVTSGHYEFDVTD